VPVVLRAEIREPWVPASPGVTVRELHEADLDNGFLDALETLTEVGMTADEARAILGELPPNLHTYVAVWQGRVVGTTSLLVERKFIHTGGRVGHIEDVAVCRSMQGRGVGTALIRYAVEEARRLDCYKVILDCFDSLVGFYERLGFRPYNRGLRLDLR
jgi:glucosamine-phosphate N-acetyltransferase